MKNILKTKPAYDLGGLLQTLHWGMFDKRWPDIREQMLAIGSDIQIKLDLPLKIDDAKRDHENIQESIVTQLEEERMRLGGDVYALPFFLLGALQPSLLANIAFDNLDQSDSMVLLLEALLNDLGIEGEYESIREILITENQWLKANDSGVLNVEDIEKAVLRLQGRIFTLWQRAEKEEIQVNFNQPPYYSVFISHSMADESFCIKLHQALKESGIRVWDAKHDMKPGRKILQQVKSAISKHDKFLLVLSQNSLESKWVETEIYKALEREKEEGIQVLFPICLIEYDILRNWELFDSDSGRDLAKVVREYYIPDFTEWHDDAKFKTAFESLLGALEKGVGIDG